MLQLNKAINWIFNKYEARLNSYISLTLQTSPDYNSLPVHKIGKSFSFNQLKSQHIQPDVTPNAEIYL